MLCASAVNAGDVEDGNAAILKNNPNITSNYGALQLGTCGTEIEMITLDSLMSSVSKIKLLKVDVEGSEPLVFYGARKIIKRDMPIIIYEKNQQVLQNDTLNKMNVKKKTYDFNIIDFCKKLGYTEIIYLHFQDIMLIPPDAKRVLNDKIFQYWCVDYIPYLKKLNIDSTGYKLYRLLKVNWNRTYDDVPKQELPDNKIINDINKYKHGVFSPIGEDGIIDLIYNIIGTTNKYFIEFEIEEGVVCNTRYLREKNDWKGIMMDRTHKNHCIGLYKEYITSENILYLFKKYKVPKTFDLLSVSNNIDIPDILNKICQYYEPRVIIIQYDPTYGLEDKINIRKRNNNSEKKNIFRIPTLIILQKKYNYSLIGADGSNVYFIKDNIIKLSKYTFANIT